MSLTHYNRRGESSSYLFFFFFLKEACCRKGIFNTSGLHEQARHLQEVWEKYHHNIFQASFLSFISLSHISQSLQGGALQAGQ